jgi:hypothetical protein
MGFPQGTAYLTQEVNGPLGQQRPVLLHQFAEIQSRQQFHHVVEDAVAGLSIIIDFDGVPVRQLGGRPDFLLEPIQCRLVGIAVGPDELDGTRSFEQGMFCLIHIAHPACTELPFQAVWSEPAHLNLVPRDRTVRAGSTNRELG